MASQATFLRELRHTLLQLRRDVETDLYYLEAESLTQKPAPDKWSILEIIEHINLVNFHYIEQIDVILEDLPALENDEFEHSWLGKLAMDSLRPDEGRIKFKVKTFNKVDPAKLQATGERTLVPNVVFRDFVNGMDRLLKLMEASEEKQVRNYKVRMLIPILKMNILDSYGFLIAHTERHLLQARRTMEEITA